MKNPRILYVSCHTILEYDELRMFRDIGASFFALGSYINPDTPHENSRPPLLGCQRVESAFPDYHKMCEANQQAGLAPEWHGKRFTKEFLDHFDVIVVMHIPTWVTANWDVLRGRNVVWRTIGQSVPRVEDSLRTCRNEGLKIVRYSPMERAIPDYIGEDALIRFGKYKEDFKQWTGEIERVITVGQHMKKRGWFCNYDLFMEVTQGFPSKLYGKGNEDGEVASYDELLTIFAQNRVYFYTGTRPASYTLNFIEAAMTGIPIVSIGEKSTTFEGHDYFEVERLLSHYKAGFASDSVEELRKAIQGLLSDKTLAETFSVRLRNMAVELFDAEKIKPQWSEFFNTL